jgi:hemin uptake protein HemP
MSALGPDRAALVSARPVTAERGCDTPDAPRYDARRLLSGAREAQLILDGKAYTLRLTRQGKLLLTK